MANKHKIKLPAIYTEKDWEQGGKIPEYKKYIGKYRVSNSQLSSWIESSGFNTGLEGKIEFMMNRFLGKNWPDIGWGEFGNAVESVIRMDDEYNKYLGYFDKEELKILSSIEPLGNFEYQTIYYIEELDTIIMGYIDDIPDPQDNVISLLRDYKTRSASGRYKLGNKDDWQLDIYKESLKQQFGWKVENAEHCVIERGGGMELYKNPDAGVGVLYVKGGVWYKKYEFKDFEKLKRQIIEIIKDLSIHYQAFLNLK